MSDRSSFELAGSLMHLLSGAELESGVGTTFELITVGEEHWPHVALLSVGEIVATDPRSLRLALWSSSGTAANLRRSAHGLLTFVHEHRYYKVRLTAVQIGSPLVRGRPLAVFVCTVVEVTVDEAPYATVTGGITFELEDGPATLNRWSETLQALRDA